MARLKRYDLYEGDGEEIRDDGRGYSLPGRQPMGRDEGLRERDDYDRRAEYAASQRKRRYFASNEEDDGLGAPSTLFDDFDRFTDRSLEEKRPKYRRPKKKQGGWIAVSVFCALILTALVLFTLPQLTGIRYRFLPNLAFVDGNLIRLDEKAYEEFSQNKQVIYQDRIFAGVYIDGIHVGGMTREEAVRAVNAAHEDRGSEFDITVSVGNMDWHVTPDRVPITRNTEETVNRAWTQGRNNTAAIRGTGMTPFAERVQTASSMRSYPVQYTTELTYDRKMLRALTDEIVAYVDCDPVNSTVATFDFNTKTFTFTDDAPGARLDPDDLYAQVAALLDAEDWHGALRAVPEKVLAEVTRAELMNSFGLISAYTTTTTSNKNRNTNIRLSAEAINGLTVLPGETFSFNKATGERTAAKGYKEAAAISGGQSKDEVGGGVCQTSSTLFNAVARADLEIVTRYPHAWPSSYVEKGFDATVNWPGVDFEFKNNTDWPIFILAGYSNRKITVNLYGMSLGADMKIDLESKTVRVLEQPSGVKRVQNTSLPVGTEKKTVTGRKGYVVETWKVWYQGGKEVRRELLFTSTYKAYQETVEYN